MVFNYVVFKTKDRHYLYDGVSSNFFEINEDLFFNHEYIFGCITNGTKPLNLYTNSYNDILNTIESGNLSPSHAGKAEFWFDIEQYKVDLQNDICHLMIGITEKCNMRCKYCIYSGHYANERKHGNKHIQSGLLLKSIDEFFKISKSDSKIVNFYGGEPFLSFETIQHAVEYINAKDNSVRIYITTNGTLLDRHVRRWFFENKNVNLFISIAGYPSLHDELRNFENNTKSFNIIKSKLLCMKHESGFDYMERVHFIFNLFSEAQLIESQHFFQTDEMFDRYEKIPEITFIDCADGDEIIKDLSRDINTRHKSDINPLAEYIMLLKNNDTNNIIVKHFDNKYMNIHRRTNFKDNILCGVCRPFIKKMFIDVDGNINICENFVSQCGFGNIRDGFSYNSITELLKTYSLARNKTCAKCWASKVCSLCFRDLIDKDGTVNEARAKYLCDSEKCAIRAALAEYCEILEHGESLLDHLDDYTLHV